MIRRQCFESPTKRVTAFARKFHKQKRDFTTKKRKNYTKFGNGLLHIAETAGDRRVSLDLELCASADIESTNLPRDDNSTTSKDPVTNFELLSRIKSECRERTFLRIQQPSNDWRAGLQDKKTMVKLQKLFEGAKLTMPMLRQPISIGDLIVTLNLASKLHIVVKLPHELNSETYTFLSEDGEIIYGPKHCISLRIPGVLPASLVDSLDFIQLERKYPGIAPSGMPDSSFSRSRQTTSLERKKWKSDINKLETTDRNEIGNEVKLHNVGDDLLVAQAASQFLTDTDVNTFIVPSAARKVYADQLRNLSIASVLLISTYVRKLDHLYREYQELINDKYFNYKKVFSIFELYDLVTRDLQQDGASRCDFKIHTVPFVPRKCFPQKIPIIQYLAFMQSLKRSSLLWHVEIQKSIMSPVSVRPVPILNFQVNKDAERVLSYQNQQKLSTFFSNQNVEYFMPKSCLPIVKALRAFASDGCIDDQITSSLVSTLVKKTDTKLREVGLVDGNSSFKARLRAHQILTHFKTQKLLNPVLWRYSTNSPYTDTSAESDILADYHKYVDKALNQDPLTPPSDLRNQLYREDPLKKIRSDFGDTPIYCIDSAFAHEVDDGISLSELDDSYLITIHIANPTAIVKPKSFIAHLAFDVGATSYLPEGPRMMLPKTISNICGLRSTTTSNKQEKKRTFAIQFKLNKAMINSYLDRVRSNNYTKVTNELAEKVLENINETAEIRALEVSNLPGGFTYEKVNQILNDVQNVKAFREQKLAPASHESNLFLLYHMSSIIKHVRVKIGKGLELSNPALGVKVEYESTLETKPFSEIKNGWAIKLDASGGLTPIITLTNNSDGSSDQGPDSKSQQLVSNFMIAANYAGAKFCSRLKIPIIYKGQNLNLSKNVQTAVDNLTAKLYDSGEVSSPEEVSAIMSILSSASFTTNAANHISLGLEMYLNFTSPLRRYVDMVNHWNIELFLLKHAGVKRQFISNLDFVANHLQGCEFVNKTSQRQSNRFWICKFLEKYFLLKQKGAVEKPIVFSFVLKSDARYGDVEASILEFPGVQIKILQNDYINGRFARREFEIGKVVKTTDFRVISLDSIEGRLEIELSND